VIRVDEVSRGSRRRCCCRLEVGKLLYPEKLDIDKMPESPTKHVIDLLKQVAVVARGGTGK